MRNEELKVLNNKERKKLKQYKVTVSKEGFDRAEEFLGLLNNVSKRRIKMSEIIDYCIEQLDPKDFPKIQERVYTSKDRFDLLLDKLNTQHPEKPVTKEDLLSTLLASFEGAKFSPSKLAKNRIRDSELPLGTNEEN